MRPRAARTVAITVLPALTVALQLPPLPQVSIDSGAEGFGRFGGGGYGTALKVCADVLRNPQEPTRWKELGTLLHGKGRLDAAAMALQYAIGIDPSHADAHVALAEVLRGAGRFEEAFSSLHAAEKITGVRNQALCYEGYATTRSHGGLAPTVGVDRRRLGTTRVTDVATPAECEWVIKTAEAHNAAKGGWACRQPRFAPAGTAANAVRAPDMLVADDPELLEWLNQKCDSTILPALEAQFGLRAAELWLYDTFLLKFSGVPGEGGLGIHVDDDGLGLSFNILLSDPSDFEGGGTRFAPSEFSDDEVVYTPQRGQMLSHYGGLRHASVPCTGGLRYIMVGFLRSEALVQLGYLPSEAVSDDA